MNNIKIELPKPHYDYLVVVLESHIKSFSHYGDKDRDLHRMFVQSILNLVKMGEEK